MPGLAAESVEAMAIKFGEEPCEGWEAQGKGHFRARCTLLLAEMLFWISLVGFKGIHYGHVFVVQGA